MVESRRDRGLSLALEPGGEGQEHRDGVAAAILQGLAPEGVEERLDFVLRHKLV